MADGDAEPQTAPKGQNGADGDAAPQATASLPFWKTFIYGMPGGALLPFTGMWALYGNKFYEEFGASLAIIALFTAVARSFDLVADPLMSYITDQSGTGFLSCGCFKKYGRRRPYMFVGAFFMSGSVWMLLNPPYVDGGLLSIWFGFFYVTYYVWETITAIPYNAFGAELSDNSDERTGAFFMEGLFEGMGAMAMVSAPVGFAMISVPFYSNRNEAICRPSEEMAAQCLMGNGCTTFFEEGWDSAFTSHASLTSTLAGAASKAVTGVLDYRVQCAAWEVAVNRADEAIKVISGSAIQNDVFCQCYDTCDKACEVAENRTAFMCVGYMFAIYLIPTVWLSCCILRSIWDPAIHGAAAEPGEKVKAPPLVPSLMSTMDNRPFRILLPTWTCDGLVQAVVMALPYYYVQAVIAPSYMTKEDHGIDCAASSPTYTNPECTGPGNTCTGLSKIEGTPDYHLRCNVDMVIAFAGAAFLLAAVASVPFWYFLVTRIGKHRAWIGFSLAHGVASVGFLFLGEGQVTYLWLITALNGIPFGAKFLNDSVLADIVDYDEFLTGARKEATYFMAKSFIPKVVQIPAAVLPIAFLPAAGYVQPINGVIQFQPRSVMIYIKCVSFVGVIAAICAFFLKFHYKLRDVDTLQKSLKDIKEGREGIDPITGMLWKPENVDQRDLEERDVFYECSYFSKKTKTAILGGDRKAIMRKVRVSLGVTLLTAVLCIVGVVRTVQYLDNENWSFMPTLFMIGCGLSVATNMFTYTRYAAVVRLIAKLDAPVVPHDPDSPRRSAVIRQSTKDSVSKNIDYVEKRDLLGGAMSPSREDSSATVGTTDTPTIPDEKPAVEEAADEENNMNEIEVKIVSTTKVLDRKESSELDCTPVRESASSIYNHPVPVKTHVAYFAKTE